MSLPEALPSDSRRDAQWDVRAGPGNYLSLVGAQLGTAGAGLATLWLATKLLGSAGYGGVVALVAASQCVGLLTVQWSALSVTRFGCEEFVETGGVRRSFWSRLLLVGASLGLAAILSPWWLTPVARWLAIPAALEPFVFWHLVATTASSHVQHTLQAAKLPRLQSALLLGEKLGVTLVLLLVTLAGQVTLASVILLLTVAPAVVSFAGLVRLRHLIGPPAVDPAFTRRMLKFSRPLVLHAALGYLGTQYLDAFFIMRFSSASDLGIYSVAYQLSGSLLQFASLLGSLLLVFFITSDVEAKPTGIERFFATVLPSLTLVWSVGCVLAAGLGSFAIELLFPASVAEAGSLLWPLLAGVSLLGPTVAGFAPLAHARSATHIPTLAVALAAATNLLGNFLWVPRFGSTGCAWATACAFGASTLLCAAVVPRRLGVSRSWTVEASAPALVGAAASYFVRDAVAVALSLAVAALLLWIHRAAFSEAVQSLAQLPALERMARWVKLPSRGSRPLAVRGESVALHRERRGARLTRRDN